MDYDLTAAPFRNEGATDMFAVMPAGQKMLTKARWSNSYNKA
jgi:hypothetical protein